VLRKLRTDNDTRQAVVVIPRPTGDTKDEPCTVSFQFLLRDGELHLIVSMRSSDAWLGVPYDTFTFTQLQNCVAGALGVPRGEFIINAGSAHLYESNVADALAVLTADHHDTLQSPALPGFPPTWLEHVLMFRDLNSVPAIAIPGRVADSEPNNVWFNYACVLLSSTNAEARGILETMNR